MMSAASCSELKPNPFSATRRRPVPAGVGVALMTKLDEISRVIGNIEAEVRGLSASVAEVRQSSAEHHRETRERLESISGRVAKIEADMKPLAKTVATMEPIVAGYAVTRWKIAGAFALGTSIITALGWIVSLFAGKIVAWVVSLFR
jgi:predicted phage tail protein